MPYRRKNVDSLTSSQTLIPPLQIQTKIPKPRPILLVWGHFKWHWGHRLSLLFTFCRSASNYRRLSLSQSPGDQTKYFELSVVWDSQFAPYTCIRIAWTIVTTTCMYMYLETAYSSLNIFWLSCSFLTLILRRLWQKLKNVDDYLHQRMPLNSVQSLKLQRRRYVHFGYNQTHLTAWLCWLLV